MKTGINELSLTTREVTSYETLVNNRIKLLKDNNIRLNELKEIVCELDFLSGAKLFFDDIVSKYNVILVSDAFKPLVDHFWLMLDKPHIECHCFEADNNGFINKTVYSRSNGKQSLVKEYIENDAEVFAIGDAFNDLEMLRMADKGYLFNPSEETRRLVNDILIVNNYDEVLKHCP